MYGHVPTNAKRRLDGPRQKWRPQRRTTFALARMSFRATSDPFAGSAAPPSATTVTSCAPVPTTATSHSHSSAPPRHSVRGCMLASCANGLQPREPRKLLSGWEDVIWITYRAGAGVGH